MALISIEEARSHLQVDTLAHDPWLNTWIPAVEAAIFSWLKQPWRAYEPSGELDSQGDPIPAVDLDDNPIPKRQVKAAALVELAQHFRYRDGSGAAEVPSHWGHGYVLGVGATSLLAGVRKGTVQ